MNTETVRTLEYTVPPHRQDWRVTDIIGGSRQLNFSKPFLPEGLARVRGLDFLTPREKTILNHIRAYEYLSLMGLLKAHVLPHVLDRARPMLREDDYRARVLMRAASDESKHIELFNSFAEAFRSGFPTDCAVIGPESGIADQVLDHHPLAVALFMLHIGWMAQAHYAGTVKEDRKIDSQFSDLFKYHWYDEAQRVKTFTLLIEALTARSGRAEIAAAADEYLKITVLLDASLMEQVELNLENLHHATGRQMTRVELAEYRMAQQQALRSTYLGSGMAHPNFLATVERLDPEVRQRIHTVALAFG